MNRQKIIIYQIFTRLFGNRCTTRKENGTVAENGCGKMNFFDAEVLGQIKSEGFTHVWYTGLIRHASTTDYTSYGIPRQHPAIVKGKAGSPYAITDYYDIDPDLAEDVDRRMDEFKQLVDNTHKSGLKMIIDFVPNHVARQYKSVTHPKGVRDLGEDDDKNMGFTPRNDFYYCVNEPFTPSVDLFGGETTAYSECPAMATGNDHFDSHPGINDWYETVKINYGVDYCDAGGRSVHFCPTPSAWQKMADILLYWASKGVDGFRCDMAEMVPVEFWKWAIAKVKTDFPDIVFIAEVYNPALYRNYISSGFDYLYDKVGMYDTMRAVTCGNCDTSAITACWQTTDDIHDHMLFFLENHDEQRIASDFFAGNGFRAYPALAVNALMRKNPFMVYAGQEYGERGMDQEGFSGCDGRTTIFDYWTIDSIHRAYIEKQPLDDEQKLCSMYSAVLNIAQKENAVSDGEFFDLMYVNPQLASRQYAFLRKAGNEMLLVAANFSGEKTFCDIKIPDHAYDFLHIPEEEVSAEELLTGTTVNVNLKSERSIQTEIGAFGCVILKFIFPMEQDVVFNEHNKEEFPPAHTAEHLLNQTMVRMFGCERSCNAHIERRKSKISFIVDHKPSRKEENEIETRMNELIEADMPVRYETVDKDNLPDTVKADRLPQNASDKIRLVYIGDYDVCPCIGKHVRSTRQIGKFVMLGTNWDEMKHQFRIRFKIV